MVSDIEATLTSCVLLPSTPCPRHYVQPQWLFDCVNARRLLPVDDYCPGAVLPPHLSPFVREEEGDYVPPERARMEEEGAEVVETEAADAVTGGGSWVMCDSPQTRRVIYYLLMIMWRCVYTHADRQIIYSGLGKSTLGRFWKIIKPSDNASVSVVYIYVCSKLDSQRSTATMLYVQVSAN